MLRALRRDAERTGSWEQYANALERAVSQAPAFTDHWVLVEWVPEPGDFSRGNPPWGRDSQTITFHLVSSQKNAYKLMLRLARNLLNIDVEDPGAEELFAHMEHLKGLVDRELYDEVLSLWNENELVHEAYSVDIFECAPRYWVFGPIDDDNFRFHISKKSRC